MRGFDKQMEMVLYHSDEGDVSVDAYILNDSINVKPDMDSKGLLAVNGGYYGKNIFDL